MADPNTNNPYAQNPQQNQAVQQQIYPIGHAVGYAVEEQKFGTRPAHRGESIRKLKYDPKTAMHPQSMNCNS